MPKLVRLCPSIITESEKDSQPEKQTNQTPFQNPAAKMLVVIHLDMEKIHTLTLQNLKMKAKNGKVDKYHRNNSTCRVNLLSQIKLTSSELKSWLEIETGSVLTPVQTQAQKIKDEMKIALQNLSEASQILVDVSQKEIDKRNMKVFNRAKALNKLAHLFIERIKKLEPPAEVSYDNLSRFAQETSKTYAVTEIDIKNWFPRISPFFIMDRRKFLTTYEKSKFTLNSLNDFLTKEYVKSKTLEKTFELIDELQSLEKQFHYVAEQRASLENERRLLENDIANLEQETSSSPARAILEQLSQTEAECDALNKELKQALGHLQKPFLKMQALQASGGGAGLTPDQMKMLDLYMNNPFEAIVMEKEDTEVLNEILEKLSYMLVEDKLKLKTDKARKAEQAVEEILKKAALANMHSKCAQVAEKKNQLLTSAEMEEAKKTLNLFQQQLETLMTRKGNLQADEGQKQNQQVELLEKIKNRKTIIEANVQSFLGKLVQIA